MGRLRKGTIKVVVVTLALLSGSAVLAKTTSSQFPNIKIKNFGQMDERFYRGARPKAQDLPGLRDLGIKTIIDLTDNSSDYERPAVEAVGLRYINIPMADKAYPQMDQIAEFLRVVNDSSTGKFFVHCAGGRHRTGIVGAIYRFTQNGWNYDQAVTEMNQFDFGSGFGHDKQKQFVKDYWEKYRSEKASAASQF